MKVRKNSKAVTYQLLDNEGEELQIFYYTNLLEAMQSAEDNAYGHIWTLGKNPRKLAFFCKERREIVPGDGACDYTLGLIDGRKG